MKRAFTIIEVLISLAIFGMASVMLVGGYMNVLNAYSRLKPDPVSPALEVQFARSLMLNTLSLSNAEAGQYQTVDGGSVQWTADIEQSTLQEPNLFDVTVTYDIALATGEPITKSEFLRVLRPTWAVAADTTQLQQTDQQRIQSLQSSQ